MSKRFQVVVADLPWSFADRLTMSDVKRGAAANYPTLTISELKRLPVKNLLDDDAILCLWCPSALLKEGIELMECYGCKLKQSYIWVKHKKQPLKSLLKPSLKLLEDVAKSFITKKDAKQIFRDITEKHQLSSSLSFYLGHTFRNTHEICLIGTHGKIHRELANRSQRSVCFAPNLKHSAKPEALQDALEMMYPNAVKSGGLLELFARRQREGWICLGNEIDGLDIRDALDQLLCAKSNGACI